MKKTLVCPKCEGRLLLRIESLKLPSADMQSIATAMSSRPASLPVMVRAKWSGVATQGGFELFICKGCGFSELYAHGYDDIEADDKLGIQIIDNRPPTTLR